MHTHQSKKSQHNHGAPELLEPHALTPTLNGRKLFAGHCVARTRPAHYVGAAHRLYNRGPVLHRAAWVHMIVFFFVVQGTLFI